MRGRSALLVTGVAVAVLAAGTPANAAPLEKGHFHDVATNFFDCDGTPVQEDVDVSGNFLGNQRGPQHPFPYFRDSVHGTIVWTNLDSGGTYTQVFTSNTRDHTIVDNGDGTITITVFSSGGSRYYDQNGKLVLKDSGQTRFAFDRAYNGTPGNPEDDIDVSGSFRIVRDSTGRSDTEGRDFCADVVEFTT